MKLVTGLAVLGGAATVLASAITPRQHRPRQASFQPQNTTESERAAAVIEAFRHAWGGYFQYAFPNDQLNPVTNTSSNPR